jgi:uncharacterized protein (UPF0332 family)
VNEEALDLWQRARTALSTAEVLVERDPDAAASRAYYAAFYAVSAYLTLTGSSFRKHTAVERAVHRDLVRPGLWPQELGTTFSWLVSLRYTGDYGGAQHVPPGEATEAAGARAVLNAVQAAPETFQST